MNRISISNVDPEQIKIMEPIASVFKERKCIVDSSEYYMLGCFEIGGIELWLTSKTYGVTDEGI